MEDYKKVSLLEGIFLQFGCKDFNDLRCLPTEQRQLLADKIETISENSLSLMDYNEVLHIVAGIPPEGNKDDARAKLLATLRVIPSPKQKNTQDA